MERSKGNFADRWVRKFKWLEARTKQYSWDTELGKMIQVSHKEAEPKAVDRLLVLRAKESSQNPHCSGKTNKKLGLE